MARGRQAGSGFKRLEHKHGPSPAPRKPNGWAAGWLGTLRLLSLRQGGGGAWRSAPVAELRCASARCCAVTVELSAIESLQWREPAQWIRGAEVQIQMPPASAASEGGGAQPSAKHR